MDPTDPITFDLVWHSLGGGAIVAGVLTLIRVILELRARRGEQAEARLERQLQERLNEAALRLERYEREVASERHRSATLERDYALLQQAHHLLSDQFGALQTDHAVLIGEHRLLLAAQQHAGRPRV